MGEKQKRNINNIFYGVIGVITLMVAVIGATFAYFTATASNNVAITGNMATVDFDVQVKKVSDADNVIGMIPMSNNMMQQALTSNKGLCKDDNGNAVCQVYKITVINESSASIFVDGYVTLTGGSGTPEDWETVTDAEEGTTREWQYSAAGAETTMRWAQAFCTTETNDIVSNCSTGGNSTVRPDTTISIPSIGGSGVASQGFNRGEILNTLSAMTTTAEINNNNNTVINKNYIRISDHLATDTTYSRTEDVTSALVFSQFLNANDNNADNNGSTATSSTTMTDAQVYYIVIWLSENGHNQTAGATGAAENAIAYYQGKVKFVSAQGAEVTAAFADHVRVTPNTSAGI